MGPVFIVYRDRDAEEKKRNFCIICIVDYPLCFFQNGRQRKCLPGNL